VGPTRSDARGDEARIEADPAHSIELSSSSSAETNDVRAILPLVFDERSAKREARRSGVSVGGSPIDESSLRQYLERPWQELTSQTEEHRVAAYARDPEWTWRTAAALREAVVRANPGWPTKESRQEDLAHHLALRSLLSRAAHAFRNRRRAR
jgi:hypothetical protein